MLSQGQTRARPGPLAAAGAQVVARLQAFDDNRSYHARLGPMGTRTLTLPVHGDHIAVRASPPPRPRLAPASPPPRPRR